MCVYVCVIVAGIRLTDNDLAPLELGGGAVEVVEQFKYLGSLVEACGCEVSCRIAQAFGTFGSLCDSVFNTSDLTMETMQEDSKPICSVGSMVLKPGPPASKLN